MGDRLIMNKKERRRKAILDQVFGGFMLRKDACKRLGISERQLKRIISRYTKEGDAGLIHKSRGKVCGHAYPEKIKEKALSLYRDKYLDFGPTFASEKLEEDDGVKVHPETLRLWLKAEGLWQSHRKRNAHRKQRARRARYGELVQLDGSIHAWLPGMDAKQCLMNMVDDATGKTLALMDTGETTRAAFALLKWWVTQAGIPLAIYVDLKSLYVSPKALKQDEEAIDYVEPEWLTHFSKACKKLGIEVIKAYSAQAKGRVERSHAVYQDRFVKELKLKGINTIEGANELLSSEFVNKLNAKFAKEPSDPADAHVGLSGNEDLDQILCWEESRQVRNDWTLRYKNQHYQLEKGVNVHPKQYVIVRRHLDDSVSVWFKETRLESTLIDKPAPKTQKKAPTGHDCAAISKRAKLNKHKTPWGQFNPDWLKSKKATNCKKDVHLSTGSTSLSGV